MSLMGGVDIYVVCISIKMKGFWFVYIKVWSRIYGYISRWWGLIGIQYMYIHQGDGLWIVLAGLRGGQHQQAGQEEHHQPFQIG